MSAASAAVHLLAIVLVLSGAQKLVAPAAAEQAMRDARLVIAGRRGTGRLLGLVEMVAGLTGLIFADWFVAAAIAVVFAGFASFVIRLRSVDDGAGCGCFGASSTPPGTAHLLTNGFAVVAAVTAAVTGFEDLLSVLDDGVVIGATYSLLLLVGAGLVLSGPAVHADLADARRGEPSTSTPTFTISAETSP